MNARTSIFIRLLTLMLYIAATGNVMAEKPLLFSQNWEFPAFHNPAMAGSSDFLRIRAAGRLQWIGAESDPKYFAATADAPFSIAGHHAGAGVKVLKEKDSPYSSLQASIQGSYFLKLRTGELSIGVTASYGTTKMKAPPTALPDGDSDVSASESMPSEELKGKNFDLSAGVAYIHPRFHVGLAVSHLLSPTVSMKSANGESSDFQDYDIRLKPNVYFDIGGNIQLGNTLFILQPTLIAAGHPDGFDAVATMRGQFKKLISIGIGYRWKDAVTFSAGIDYKNFFIGYAYDCPVAGIAKTSSGSHEIVVGYSIRLKSDSRRQFRQRSIRIM